MSQYSQPFELIADNIRYAWLKKHDANFYGFLMDIHIDCPRDQHEAKIRLRYETHRRLKSITPRLHRSKIKVEDIRRTARLSTFSEYELWRFVSTSRDLTIDEIWSAVKFAQLHNISLYEARRMTANLIERSLN